MMTFTMKLRLQYDNQSNSLIDLSVRMSFRYTSPLEDYAKETSNN